MYRVKKDSQAEYLSCNETRLIRGGKPYFDLLLKLINEAVEHIHLQVYIFDDDETGIRVKDALKAAVKRKVSVHLLADGYASQVMSKKFITEMKEAGIHFRFFEPFFRSRQFYFGRRMHHKIFVADAKYALTGGINISNRYNDMPGRKAWLDFALYVEGNLARDLCVLCWKTWNSFSDKMGLTPCEKIPLRSTSDNSEQVTTKMRRNDWIRSKNEISESYIAMFRYARSHINIMCSYFLPGKVIRRLLKDASRRGVKIRVITAGPSDVKLAKYAERWMYDWLLRNNVELYEYQPSVLHAKVSVCDSEWFTIGSYNINNLSTYASIELNIDVHHPEQALQVEQVMDSIIREACIPITLKRHLQTKNIFKQVIRWFSYEIIRVVFYIITYNFKKRK